MSIRLFATGVILLGMAYAGASWRVCCAEAAQVSTVGAVITGSVVDATLAPLANVGVALEQDGRVVMRTTTGTDGTYRFAGVAPGAYRVRATRDGFPPVERDIRVSRDAATLTLPLVLSKPGDEAKEGAKGEPAPRQASVNEAAGRGSMAQATDQARAFPAPAAMAAAPASPMPSPSYGSMAYRPGDVYPSSERGEGYARIVSNRFRRTTDEPLSTFGADVDTASFANVRRFIRTGQLPPVDAVRVEEFVNYFRFDYAAPRDGHPIGITTEIGDAPWNPRHKLLLIGARAATPAHREPAGRNIVLLIDVSGSMAPADKLPLIKSALGMFVDTLNDGDQLAIVTYAGQSGVVLPPTPARDRNRLLSAIASLGSGGSTNGAQGLVTAYRLARQAFIPGGVNRVVLATDGDFNVGVTSHDGLLQLIEREKESGVFLSVLGVGTGNLQDATMELLADKGNGNYAYLDSLQEARRVLVREAGSTLETVAKDVKFQVEFNPAQVASWKLVGYENRLLEHQDFNDDRKDGGELGAGHTVTVLYEIVPVGVEAADDDDTNRPLVDPLRYQPAPERRQVRQPASPNQEWLTVKVRYQEPEGRTSRLIERPVGPVAGVRAQHLPFAAAVAEFGQLLRDPRVERGRWDALVRRLERMMVPAGRAADRTEVLELVTLAAGLSRLQ